MQVRLDSLPDQIYAPATAQTSSRTESRCERQCDADDRRKWERLICVVRPQLRCRSEIVPRTSTISGSAPVAIPCGARVGRGRGGDLQADGRRRRAERRGRPSQQRFAVPSDPYSGEGRALRERSRPQLTPIGDRTVCVWKVHYRDNLDHDRVSPAVPSKEAALAQARCQWSMCTGGYWAYGQCPLYRRLNRSLLPSATAAPRRLRPFDCRGRTRTPGGPSPFPIEFGGQVSGRLRLFLARRSGSPDLPRMRSGRTVTRGGTRLGRQSR